MSHLTSLCLSVVKRRYFLPHKIWGRIEKIIRMQNVVYKINVIIKKMFTLIIKFSPVVTLILLCYSKTDFFRGVVQKFSLNSEYPYFSLQFFHLYQIQKKFKNFVIYPYKTLRSSFCIKLSARFQRLFKFACLN